MLSLSHSEEEIVIVEAEMGMVHTSYLSHANDWANHALRMENSPSAKEKGDIRKSRMLSWIGWRNAPISLSYQSASLNSLASIFWGGL